MEKNEIEYRYYETEADSYILALIGERWVCHYGTDPIHFHNLLEIGLCRGGSGEMCFAAESVKYEKGTITIIPANYPHRTTSPDKAISAWEYLFIAVDDFILKELKSFNTLGISSSFTDSNYHITSASENPVLYDLIILILDLYRFRPNKYLEIAKSLITALLFCISGLKTKKDPLRNSSIQEENIIMGAVNYVQNNYHNKIKVENIAKNCNLSETHFRRLFEEAMGVPPLQYVNLVRIDHACRKLRNSKTPINIIASECGFSTLSSFNRNFKSLTGLSPKDWRDEELSQIVDEDAKAVLYNGWL